jgi:hypothetical protein
MHLAPEALGGRIARALDRLQGVDVERHGLALAVEEGDPAARERLAVLEKERARLVADLERLQAAKSQADARDAEAAAGMVARDREQRADAVRKLAAGCAEQVAALDGLTAQMVTLLHGLGDRHAALYAAAGGIPANGPLQNFMAALPARLRQALGKSGIAGFGAPGLMDWSGAFADDYPDAEYFAGLIQPRSVGEIGAPPR